MSRLASIGWRFPAADLRAAHCFLRRLPTRRLPTHARACSAEQPILQRRLSEQPACLCLNCLLHARSPSGTRLTLVALVALPPPLLLLGSSRRPARRSGGCTTLPSKPSWPPSRRGHPGTRWGAGVGGGLQHIGSGAGWQRCRRRPLAARAFMETRPVGPCAGPGKGGRRSCWCRAARRAVHSASLALPPCVVLCCVVRARLLFHPPTHPPAHLPTCPPTRPPTHAPPTHAPSHDTRCSWRPPCLTLWSSKRSAGACWGTGSGWSPQVGLALQLCCAARRPPLLICCW